MTDKAPTTELLPCPFCGAPANYVFDGREHWIYCAADAVCDLNPCIAGRDREYIEKEWNHRAVSADAESVSNSKDDDIDVVLMEIGHMVGARDGEHVIDAVSRYVSEHSADAESARVLRNVSFEAELTSLINRFSKENESNTPDFILAQFLEQCFSVFTTSVQQRETWYGRDARPTSAAPEQEKEEK